MNKQQSIHYALMCLKALDSKRDHAVSALKISHDQGVPLPACQDVLASLAAAGLVESAENNHFTLHRELSELTALEVVQAMVSTAAKAPRFRMWFGKRRSWVLKKTLEAVRWAERHGIYLSDNA